MNSAKWIEFFCPLAVFFAIFFCGCGRRAEDKKQKLAQTYYKLCMLEVSQSSDADDSPQTRYRKALSYIQEAIKYKTNADLLAVKATILFRLGDYAQSCQVFEQALACDGVQARVRASIMNNYACLLAQMGKADEALRIFNDLSKDSDYFTPQAAVFNRGKIFFDKQKYDNAFNEFSRAVSLAPEYIDAHYYLALAAFKLKNNELVKKEIETVLFLDPGHEGAIALSDKLGFVK